jgi:hypothetical protein
LYFGLAIFLRRRRSLGAQGVDSAAAPGPLKWPHAGLCGPEGFSHSYGYQWIGFRENLQETIDFPIKYWAFLQNFP